MAWRFEKTSTGVDLVIDGFTDGIGKNPFEGPAQLSQVNTVSMPGASIVGFPITNSTTSGGTLGAPISRATAYSSATGAATDYFILDSSGQVWTSTSLTGTWTFMNLSNSTTGAKTTDAIVVWKNYLFKFRNNAIDYITPSGGSWAAGTWVVGWDPATGMAGATVITADVQHYAIAPINDSMYFCNGHSVARVSELTTFDPTSTSTYSYSLTAFQLPYYEIAQSLAPLNSGTANSTITLMVGGSQNVIYPFLTSSPTFNTPIFLGDNFIARLVSVNQNVFAFTGATVPTGAKSGRGRIYISNSVQADEFFKIPDHITGFNDPYFQWGDAIFHRNSLVFGFQATQNDGTVVSTVPGVWAVDLDTKAFRAVSSLSTATGNAIAGALLSDQSNSSVAGYSYMVGYHDGFGTSDRHIGRSSTASGIGESFMKTEQIRVGDFYNKFTFTNMSVILQTPLQSGESCTIELIQDDSFSGRTTVMNFNTTGAISGAGPAPSQNAQWIQYRLDSVGNSQSSGVRVKELRVHCIPK